MNKASQTHPNGLCIFLLKVIGAVHAEVEWKRRGFVPFLLQGQPVQRNKEIKNQEAMMGESSLGESRCWGVPEPCSDLKWLPSLSDGDSWPTKWGAVGEGAIPFGDRDRLPSRLPLLASASRGHVPLGREHSQRSKGPGHPNWSCLLACRAWQVCNNFHYCYFPIACLCDYCVHSNL